MGIELRADAWPGEEARGAPDEESGWASRRDVPRGWGPLAPTPIDLADWRDPRVGWGVVLPDRDDVPIADKALGIDAPEPIRALLAARPGSPVLRYRSDVKEGKLRRYEKDGSAADLSLRGARGVDKNAIPRYLLICGSPAEIPWAVQYRLVADAFVGRLDLDESGLAYYVQALLGEWSGSPRDASRPVVWAVDHDHPDITWLMQETIARPLAKALAEDGGHEFDMNDGLLLGTEVTHADLQTALAVRHPAFIATSSHGATYPLSDPNTMRDQLGLLVDTTHSLLSPEAATQNWSPDGAVWYAHACCSAGADGTSKYAGLVVEGSSLERTLTAVAGLGPCTAPLPRALLGRSKPLGAFIGHVEPTFDWTLRDPTNGQVTAHHISDVLYHQLHAATRPPVGLAMHFYYRHVGGLLQDYIEALEAFDYHEPGAEERAFRAKLMAFDRLGMVVLGDPTVRLPLPR